MIIYKDIITGAEIISDSYRLKEVDGIVYEADVRQIIKGVENFELAGANPSVEEAEAAKKAEVAEPEDKTPKKKKTFDLFDAFSLQEREYPDAKARKAYYVPHIKIYMKKVVEALKANGTDEETIKEFQAGAQKYVKKIISNMGDYELYAGDSLDEPNGMHVLLNYREDGVTPYVTVWKHGLTEMKV